MTTGGRLQSFGVRGAMLGTIPADQRLGASGRIQLWFRGAFTRSLRRAADDGNGRRRRHVLRAWTVPWLLPPSEDPVIPKTRAPGMTRLLTSL